MDDVAGNVCQRARTCREVEAEVVVAHQLPEVQEPRRQNQLATAATEGR
jgi:hypothetical protein